MTEHVSSVKAGDLVAGRFRVGGILGAGGMGTVYRAVQVSLDREVALKVIHTEQASNETVRRRFLREARVAASLRHANAVEIYDFGESGDTLYMAMELLTGESLRHYVEVDLPPLELRRACRIGREIADVLAAASVIGLVHRDLKPENVMVQPLDDGTERIVVVDFGLAFRNEHTAETGRITREGMASGTPDYMSPEQVRGLPSTPAADVYALGCVVYEMLTAHSPLATTTPALTLSRHLFTTPTPMREAFPLLDIPAEVDELVMAMLRKDARERPSAVSVRDVLRRFETSNRERMGEASDHGKALGRSARMMSLMPTLSRTVASIDSDAHVSFPGGLRAVRVEGGSFDIDAETALAAHGYRECSADEVPDVVFVIGGDVPTVERLVADGRVVVGEVDATDTDRISELLRAGASDVVPRPFDGATLVRRFDRVLRKAARRGSSR